MKLLQWEAIRLFRNLGVRKFDFFGARINPQKGSKQEGNQSDEETVWSHAVRGLHVEVLSPAVARVGVFDRRPRCFAGGDIVDQEGHKVAGLPPQGWKLRRFQGRTMFTLLPNELWDYGPVEAIRGLRTAVLSRHPSQRPTVHLPGLGPCLPVRSARAAIVLALKALALPAGASVAVPLYCCPVVFKAIKAAGCRPRFVDVDPETYCLSPADLAAKSSEVDAVIAVHMFGNLCDMPRLREAAAGKPLIEDCAQALGSRLDGRAAGSFGEIAAFSFRSGKYLSVGEGGAVYSNQADLSDGTLGVDLRAARPKPRARNVLTWRIHSCGPCFARGRYGA